jgi:cytochrome c
MRRAALLLTSVVLVLAGCGGGEEVRPLPETIEGAVTQQQLEGDAERGKTIFADGGCGSCHTFAPAGSQGKIGPELNELKTHADAAGQPLDQYVRSSIVNPNAFVVDGYDEGVMPPFAGEPQDVADLVAFLTENQ